MDVDKLVGIKATILVTGESGSGKSYWSYRLAQKRERNLSAIVTVDLASLSDGLVESELFGHEKGAFTGAFQKRVGLCEQVGSGTLVLDEIGELSLESQKKLLTLLERRVFRPVGANREVLFKGKIIAATNRNLFEMVQTGTFREDLYYRLKVFHYHIPSFNSRTREEKRVIIRQLIASIMKDYSFKELPIFTREVKSYLLEHSWRGNIRQLRHALEFLVVMHQGEEITMEMVGELVSDIGGEQNIKQQHFDIGKSTFAEAKQHFEKSYLIQSFKKTKGMVNQTALLIGMNKSTLISKIRQYEINVLEFKMIPKMERVAS